MESYCERHHDKLITHFCIACNQTICVQCCFDHNPKHKILSLSDYVKGLVKDYKMICTENAKIATEINNIRASIKKRVSNIWDTLKHQIISSIDDFKSDSIKFVEGALGFEEKPNFYSSQDLTHLVKLIKHNHYLEALKRKIKLDTVQKIMNEQKQRLTQLDAIYKKLPSTAFNLSLHHTFLKKLLQSIYQNFDSHISANYGAFFDKGKLNLIYPPSFIKTVPLSIEFYNPSITQVKNIIFITGGNLGKWDSVHLKHTFTLNQQFGKPLLQKSSMLTPRAWHGLIQYNNQFLYAIAGYNEKEGVLSQCEKYLIGRDKWIKIPNLHRNRWGISTTLVNETKLYVLFGIDENQMKKDIEMLDLLNEENGWMQVLDPRNYNDTSVFERRCHSSFQLNNTEILISGGDSGKYLMPKCLNFITHKNRATYANSDFACKLHLSACYNTNRLKKHVIFKTSLDGQVVIYDMIRKVWIIVPLCPLEM